jgi:hypothetical protein
MIIADGCSPVKSLFSSELPEPHAPPSPLGCGCSENRTFCREGGANSPSPSNHLVYRSEVAAVHGPERAGEVRWRRDGRGGVEYLPWDEWETTEAEWAREDAELQARYDLWMDENRKGVQS